MAFAHELSWSVSRSGTFAACKRRYYHDYYGSWNGWSRDAEAERQRTYLLKKMTRMPMLAGDVLHQALAERYDRRSEGGDMDEAQVVEFALTKLRAGYKDSRDGRWRQRPSQLTHLAEHHYKEEQVDEASGAAGEYGKRYVERIRAGARMFFTSPALAAARDARGEDILTVEGRAAGDRRSKGLSTIELFGEKVYAIPDFALRDERAGEATYKIFDWKTGSPREQDAFQLGVYVLYAMETWGAAPEEVECIDVYLTRDDLVAKRFDEASLATVLARVEASIAEMRALHFDAGETLGDVEAFPLAPTEAGECGMCNYRELCGR